LITHTVKSNYIPEGFSDATNPQKMGLELFFHI
jgi:hypothetical protein